MQNTSSATGMPVSRRVKEAEDAACKLASQLRSPVMTQVLQRPPAVLCSLQEVEQLSKLWQVSERLCQALQETHMAETAHMLDAVLQQQAAHSAGTVLVWAQQQPEQLLTTITAGLHGVESTAWLYGVRLIDKVITAARTLQDSSSTLTGRIVMRLTEQLEQSGRMGKLWQCDRM
jgi:hypothetical protein